MKKKKGKKQAWGSIHPSILKPSRVFQRSDNSLHLQVIAEAVNALFSPMSAHLVPSKRNCSIKYIKAIDPHRADSQSTRQPVGCVDVLSKHPCGQPIATSICPPYHLLDLSALTKKLSQPLFIIFIWKDSKLETSFHLLVFQDCLYRTKNLLPCNCHVILNTQNDDVRRRMLKIL